MSFRLLSSKIVQPVIRELPIILVFFIIIKANLMEFFQDNDYDTIWDYVSVFSIWFLYSYFIAAVICISKRTWVRWLWYILLLSIYAISCFIAANFEMKICPTLITLLVETNEREASEFMSVYFFTAASIKVYIKMAIYIAIIVLFELGYRKYFLERIKRLENTYASILILFLLLAGFIRWSQYSDYFNINKPDDEDALDFPASDIYTRLFCSLCIESKQSSVIERAIDVSLNAGKATAIYERSDSLNVIFVIGESFIKSHASLYGYPLVTTPNLQFQKEKGNLYAFTDVITPYNYTSMSVKNMMSCNSLGESEKWFNSPYFPVLFKNAGYNVYFWSNQHEATDGSVYEYALSSYLYNQKFSESVYEKTNPKPFEYDGLLFDDFKTTCIDSLKSPTNLFMFHLSGQHTVFTSRFPQTEEHKRFTIKDIHKKEPYLNKTKLQYIADYDNAILYGDDVLAEIMKSFTDWNVVLVFLSDHGEEVYDYRDRMGRSYTDKVDSLYLRYQYEIPFVIWCSDRFKRNYPEVVNSIQEAVNKPFMIDNVCQLLFHLGGLQSDYYHPERDVLSKEYVPKERIIRGGEINFDGYFKKSVIN